MKPAQNVPLDESSNEFEIGSCLVKTWALDQILEKLLEHQSFRIFVRMFLLKAGLKLGHARLETRPLGQILEIPCIKCSELLGCHGTLVFKVSK